MMRRQQNERFPADEQDPQRVRVSRTVTRPTGRPSRAACACARSVSTRPASPRSQRSTRRGTASRPPGTMISPCSTRTRSPSPGRCRIGWSAPSSGINASGRNSTCGGRLARRFRIHSVWLSTKRKPCSSVACCGNVRMIPAVSKSTRSRIRFARRFRRTVKSTGRSSIVIDRVRCNTAGRCGRNRRPFIRRRAGRIARAQGRSSAPPRRRVEEGSTADEFAASHRCRCDGR